MEGNTVHQVLKQTLLVAVGAALFAVTGLAQAGNFTLASTGCPKLHCDLHDDGNDSSIVDFTGKPRKLFQDLTVGPSPIALGCTSDGAYVGCKINPQGRVQPFLKIYDGDGQTVCLSSNFDEGLVEPIFGADHGWIEADGTHIERHGPPPSCTLLWSQTYGFTLSHAVLALIPNTEGTQVSFVSQQDAVMTFDASTGALIGSPLYPGCGTRAQGCGPSSRTFYQNFNPATSNCGTLDRIYYLGENHHLHQPNGKMFGIDVTSGGVTVGATSAPYQSGNGATPMCHGNTLYTDMGHGSRTFGVIAFSDPGTGTSLDTVFGICNHGSMVGPTTGCTLADDGTPCTTGTVGKACITGVYQANFAWDPVLGCDWTGHYGNSNLICRNPSTGLSQVVYDLGNVVPGATGLSPHSDHTMTTDGNGNSVMVQDMSHYPETSGSSYVVAINTTTGALVWSIKPFAHCPAGPSCTPEHYWAGGQFPFVVSPATGQSRIMFTSAAPIKRGDRTRYAWGPMLIGPRP